MLKKLTTPRAPTGYRPTRAETAILNVLAHGDVAYRSAHELARAAGVSPQTVCSALKKPGFQEACRTSFAARFILGAPSVINGMIEEAGGNIDLYEDRKAVVRNRELVLAALGMALPGERREVTGPHGGPVQMVTWDLPTMLQVLQEKDKQEAMVIEGEIVR